MIIARLAGGMGNQLFQYALGRRLSLHHGVPLALDITGLLRGSAGATKREYTLGAFNIQSIVIGSRIRRSWMLMVEHPMFVREKRSDAFDSTVLNAPRRAYLTGFWLSPKYFADIRTTLIDDLKLKDPLSAPAREILTEIQKNESVAVHVRRGDNINNPSSAAFHGALTQKDYERAMDFFAARIPHPHFFIFSDDPAWCKEHILSKHPLTVIEGNTSYPHEDLHLMRSCKHQALANSTLSWWAAWLNENPNKIILRPPFFTKGAFSTDDLYPSSWSTLTS